MSEITEKTEKPNEKTPTPSAEVSKPKPRVAIFAILGVLALGAIYKGYGAFTFAQTHVDTDNAYVTGDLVNISPTVSGTLKELKVADGDFVHKGDLIARLQTNSSEAAIQSSRAAISTQQSRTQGSKMAVRLSSDTVRNQIIQAKSQVAEARAQMDQAKAGVDVAKAGLDNAKIAVDTAQKNADAAKASEDSARAEAVRTDKDLKRYATLFQTDAVSQQQLDTATAAANAAKANLDAATRKAEAAESSVDQARSAVKEAQSRINSAVSQQQAALMQVKVAQAGLGLAEANDTQVGIQGENVKTSEGQVSQADASLASATAGLQQIALREKQIATAKAQLEQAKAAVEHAKIDVEDASLYAPCDGYVVKHTENVGAAISPGQTIVTITRGADVWVMANYKETQLDKVRKGQPVEIEVDAYPGRVFHGKVESILEATGSATTLLPPDNATGNFTKVVQRVPVKILIDSAGETTSAKDAVLRQGMSVVATIDTASASKE